eukprot:scaffold31859_cov21-Tisochrysis_lutea.AAC.2
MERLGIAKVRMLCCHDKGWPLLKITHPRMYTQAHDKRSSPSGGALMGDAEKPNLSGAAPMADVWAQSSELARLAHQEQHPWYPHCVLECAQEEFRPRGPKLVGAKALARMRSSYGEVEDEDEEYGKGSGGTPAPYEADSDVEDEGVSLCGSSSLEGCRLCVCLHTSPTCIELKV